MLTLYYGTDKPGGITENRVEVNDVQEAREVLRLFRESQAHVASVSFWHDLVDEQHNRINIFTGEPQAFQIIRP